MYPGAGGQDADGEPDRGDLPAADVRVPRLRHAAHGLRAQVRGGARLPAPPPRPLRGDGVPVLLHARHGLPHRPGAHAGQHHGQVRPHPHRQLPRRIILQLLDR